VVTCVTRDDLPDGGAQHFVETIAEIRRTTAVAVEVLPSDFGGLTESVDRLIEAAPEVYNHNTETVPRLFRAVRGPRADYRWTLAMFRRIAARQPAIRLKTGLMLGLGETLEELLDTLADLADAGCRMLTLGQYLRPSLAQMPVARYLRPEEFDRLAEAARRLGFHEVAAGPFVRSSYHAREMAGRTEQSVDLHPTSIILHYSSLPPSPCTSACPTSALTISRSP
jgi:lipoyl synthase